MILPLVAELHPNSWAEVRALNEALSVPHVFRGQQDATWGLAPSMERAVARGGVLPQDAWDREAWILREFTRRAHQYPRSGKGESPLDILALVQHYGGPTRLLDFTHSIYVAAFFALEFATGAAVIWAINMELLERSIANEFGLPAEAGFFRLTHSKYDPIVTRELLTHQGTRAVLPVEPYQIHERMSTQQALFLFPCDLSSSFEENLASSFSRNPSELRCPHRMTTKEWHSVGPSNVPILRIVLSRRIRADVLDDLWSMNVNAATLFPGLDGFARSLHYHVRAVSSVETWLLEQQ